MATHPKSKVPEETPVRTCKHLRCMETPVVRVSGGLEPRYINLTAFGGLFRTGWSGEYCEKHVLTCVQNQLFQAKAGMPLIIEGLK